MASGSKTPLMTHSVERSTGASQLYWVIVPLFGVLLCITGITVGVLVTTEAATSVSKFRLVGLLFVQFGVIAGGVLFREVFPLNLLMAILVAVFEGVFLAVIVGTLVEAKLGYVIVQALVITGVMFTGLLVAPPIFGSERTFPGVVLLPALSGLFGITLFSLFVSIPEWWAIGVDLATVALFSLFIRYDANKIRQNEWGAVAGALSLYLDFILVFRAVVGLLKRIVPE